MSNILDFGVSSKAPSKVGGVGTAIKYFPRPLSGGSGGGAAPWSLTAGVAPNASSPQSPNTNVNQGAFIPSVNNMGPVPGGATSVPNANNPTGSLWVPNTSFDGQQFNVLVSGTYGFNTGDPSGLVTVQLQAVTGTFANPTYTRIASTGGQVPGAATPMAWAFDVTLLGDSVSGLLTGYYSALAAGNIGTIGLVNGTPKTIDNIISGLDFQNGNTALQRGAVFGLVVGVTFGTGDASNTALMTQFTVES